MVTISDRELWLIIAWNIITMVTYDAISLTVVLPILLEPPKSV